MQIPSRRYADTIVAAPAGRIDHQTATAFESALMPLVAEAASLQGGAGGLVLDFSGIEYISSVGLRVLMIAAQRARAQQTRLAMAELRSLVAEIFAISRFDRVLAVHATVEAALAQGPAAALDAWRTAAAAR